MIFDNDKISKLVIDWQKTQDPELMGHILEGSTSLIESIVSIYNPLDRDDLIQEACIKVQHASSFFNPKLSNLHNYFTTVIRNCCCTYSTKQNREVLYHDYEELDYRDDEEGDLNMSYTDTLHSDAMLHDIIERNRNRFSTITPKKMEKICKHIYTAMAYDSDNGREIIAQISDKFKLGKVESSIIFNSTLIYLRNKHITCSIFKEPSPVEYTLLPDLREVVGNESYEKIVRVFSGMTLHISK